jgi:hypothetical protein
LAYEIKNGELLRQGVIRDRTPKSHLKRSFTLTETTASNSNVNVAQEPPRSNQPPTEVNTYLTVPRNNTNDAGNFPPRSNNS